MACARAIHPRPFVWPRQHPAAGTLESARDIYAASGPGAVYRLRLLPIPYAISVWIRGLSVHGQRYAGPL